jgi:hypothetical protein
MRLVYLVPLMLAGCATPAANTASGHPEIAGALIIF